jgi:hypothetical protein
MNINFTDVHTNKGFYRFLNKHSNIPRTTCHGLSTGLTALAPLPIEESSFHLYSGCCSLRYVVRYYG